MEYNKKMISLFWRILLINVKSQSVLFLFLWVFFSKDCESNNNCNRDSPSRENKRIVEIFKNSGFSVNETWAIITTAFTIVAWTVFTDLNNDEITGKPCSFYPSGILASHAVNAALSHSVSLCSSVKYIESFLS